MSSAVSTISICLLSPVPGRLQEKCWIAGTEFEDAFLLINRFLINSDYSAFLGAGTPERSPYE